MKRRKATGKVVGGAKRGKSTAPTGAKDSAAKRPRSAKDAAKPGAGAKPAAAAGAGRAANGKKREPTPASRVRAASSSAAPLDPVRTLLRDRGTAEHVVARGLPGLLAAWEETVREVAAGYPLGLDDYLNDMDARQILEEALAVAGDAERAAVEPGVAEADQRMKALVVPAPRCLWGPAAARAAGWEAGRNWWYFVRPRDPGPDLAEELGD